MKPFEIDAAFNRIDTYWREDMATETKPTKAIVAGVGSTLTALATLWAVVSTAYENNGLDIGEYGTILTAVLACVGTVRAVWSVTNYPKAQSGTSPNRDLGGRDQSYDMG